MRRAWITLHRGLAALSVRRFGPRYAAALLRYADRHAWLRYPAPTVRLRFAQEAVAVSRRCGSPGELAAALAVLTHRLRRMKRPDDALATAQEAVQIDGSNPDAWHALALALDRFGRLDEALAAATAAVALYRPRAGEDPKRMNRRLADALDTAGMCLVELGRREEALAAYDEAVTLFDETPTRLQMRYFEQIQVTRTNLVRELYLAGRYERALEVGEAALSDLNLLASVSSSRARPVRAPLLRYRAYCQGALERFEEARATAEKEVADQRRLAAVDPARYEAALARALDCLAAQQKSLGHHVEAAATLREAIEIRARLSVGDPATHQADLADTWGSLSNLLWNVGERTGAIDANRESEAAYRLTADHEPLAEVLCVLSTRLHTAGRPAEAVAAGREAVSVGRRLAEHDAEVHDPLLGRCLSDLSKALSGAGQLEEAVAAGREAVETYRRLAARDLPERAGLCEALHDLAILLSNARRHSDAVDVMGESIRIRELLVADDPADHEPDLGRALRQRSYDLHAVGRRAEALPDIDAAIELFRRLAAADPAEHLLNAAYTLSQAARQRAGAARAGEVVEHLRELYDLSRRHDSPEVHRIVVGAFEQVYQDADEVERAWRQITGTPYPEIC